MGLHELELVNSGVSIAGSLVDIGFQEFQKGLAVGIMSEWPILRSDGGDLG